MKRLILVICVCCIACAASFAQTDTTTVKQNVEPTLSDRDNLLLDELEQIIKKRVNPHPRYKLYKTENTYNLIKLDTATGRLWQVQYGMNNSSDRMEVPIDDTELPPYFGDNRPGRYELYPTNNMYTFILIDTQWGDTYQVQWHTNPNQRFRIRIK